MTISILQIAVYLIVLVLLIPPGTLWRVHTGGYLDQVFGLKRLIIAWQVWSPRR
jgi:hypothetical protein